MLFINILLFIKYLRIGEKVSFLLVYLQNGKKDVSISLRRIPRCNGKLKATSFFVKNARGLVDFRGRCLSRIQVVKCCLYARTMEA
jgi:hypothetical protein